MLNIIVKAVFYIIGKIGDIVLLPVMLVINSFLPSNFSFTDIINYLQSGFNYMQFFFKLLLIPPSCISIVFFVFQISLGVIVGVRAYAFIVKIYEKFKP